MALIFSLIVIVYILMPLPGNFRYLGAAVVVGLFLLIMLPSTLRSREMENSGVHVTGVVIGKDCSKIKNQIVKYRFNVHGIYYENSSKPGYGNRECYSLNPGDQIFITYANGKPEINDASRDVHVDYTSGTFLSIFAFFMISWMNWEQKKFRFKKKHKNKNKT